jgi:hypothetical protein
VKTDLFPFLSRYGSICSLWVSDQLRDRVPQYLRYTCQHAADCPCDPHPHALAFLLPTHSKLLGNSKQKPLKSYMRSGICSQRNMSSGPAIVSDRQDDSLSVAACGRQLLRSWQGPSRQIRETRL